MQESLEDLGTKRPFHAGSLEAGTQRGAGRSSTQIKK
jgi:hypothetical protein